MADEVKGGDLDGQEARGLFWDVVPWRAAAVGAAGYLAGSVPIAVIVGRRRGIDPRLAGDRNPGFWNSRSLLGGRMALLVFAGDSLKGLVGGLAGVGAGGGAYVQIGVGGAMLGHAAPLFAGLRGGRSVLTYAGGMAVISPPTFAASWALCLGVTAATGSFTLGARAGVFGSPLLQLLIERDPHRVAGTGILMTFIGLRFLAARRGSGGQPRGRTCAPASGAPAAAGPR